VKRCKLFFKPRATRDKRLLAFGGVEVVLWRATIREIEQVCVMPMYPRFSKHSVKFLSRRADEGMA
jgi:hypothetical protein